MASPAVSPLNKSAMHDSMYSSACNSDHDTSVESASDTSKSATRERAAPKGEARNTSSNDAASGPQRSGSNKFRCRVAMACVHCRHRKIRCDGAQPSCYTCTRLQRKCEYERVSEHDNLLSRERKRLSRERKAARIAANVTHSGSNSPPQTEEKMHSSVSVSPLNDPAHMAGKPQSPPFPIPVVPLGMTTPANAADMCASMVPTAGDATIAPAWATTQGMSQKDMLPWMVQPPVMASMDASLHAPPPTSSSEGAAQDTLASLRSTADPSLLEMSALPLSSNLSDESPSLMSMGWTDSDKQSESPREAALPPHHLTDFGSALNPVGTDSPAVGEMDMDSAIDTPLKLFSDVKPLPGTMTSAPSSLGSNTLSNSSSTMNSSIAVSPLSPQLAPSTFEEFGEELSQRPFAGFGTPEVQQLGLYSSSLPIHDSGLAYGGEFEASSLPVFSSPWKQLASK